MLLLTCVVLGAPVVTNAQALVYQGVVDGFPLNRGIRVPEHFWDSYQKTFQKIADTVRVDSSLIVELTGMVDGTPYTDRGKDDPLNGGLAISRCIAVKQQLENAGVRADHIVFRTPERVLARGPQYRKVTITVTRPNAPEYITRRELVSAFAAQPKAEPVIIEKPIMQCQGQHTNTYALWLGVGVTYNAFDKFVPLLQGQVGNRRLRFVADFSHSLYTVQKTYASEELDVNYRFIACYLAYHPLLYGTVEFTAGWQRTEEYATRYGMYTRKCEGPEIGIRYSPVRRVAFQLVYAPGELSSTGQNRVGWDNSRVRASIVIATPIIGGGR